MATTYAIFIDDYRQPRRDDGIDWVRCETVSQMQDVLQLRGAPSLVSFDFDLSGTETYQTGMDALMAFLDALKQMPTDERNEVEVRFHSSDLNKRSQMRSALNKRQNEMALCEWNVRCPDPTEMIDKILGGEATSR